MKIAETFPQKFEEFMCSVKRRKPNPIQENIRNVARFFDRLKQKGVDEIEAIQFRDIIDYQIYLSNQPAGPTSRNAGGLLAPSTIQHNITSIKNYLKFVNSYYDIGLSATRIELPKVPKAKVNFLTFEEIVWILNYINESTPRPDTKMRNLLIVKTAFTTGMRKSEMLNLKFSDIRAHSNEVQIVGKGDKVRTVFFTDSLKRDIENYRKMRENPRAWSNTARTTPLDDKDFVFVCHSDGFYGQPLTGQSMHTLITAYREEFIKVFGHSFSLHSFRHSFATEAIKAGTQVALLKELLGHSDISTTMGYVHLNNNDLFKAWENIPKIE